MTFVDFQKYFKTDIIETLTILKDKFDVVDFTKIDEDSFIKLPEEGFYFQAIDSNLITICRIYLMEYKSYLPASTESRGIFKNIHKKADLIQAFGKPIKAVRSVHIPGIEPTPRGDIFQSNTYSKITGYYSDDTDLIQSIVLTI